MDFTLPPEIDALRLRLRAFIAEEVMPLEQDPDNFNEYENLKLSVLDQIRARARDAGIWAPQMPKARGGLELPVVGWAAIYEEAARSIFGPLAINCQAPDDGNMSVLNKTLADEGAQGHMAAADHRRQGALVLRHDRAASGLGFRSRRHDADPG